MPELDYRALNRRAQTALKRQKSIARWVFFALSLFIFLLFLGFGWAFFGGSTTSSTMTAEELKTAGMIMLTTGGGLVLMFQFISAILETSSGEAQMRARIMERLVAEEIMRLGEAEEGYDEEKAKRMMRLTDDGELEEVIEEEMPPQSQRQIARK